MHSCVGGSVELPHLSTVILPVIVDRVAGHTTGMNSPPLPEILDRIDQRLKLLGSNDARASKKAGHPDAIRNMRRAVKNNDSRRGITTATLSDLADALETSPQWLINGEGLNGLDQQQRSVPVIGTVGAEGAVHFSASKREHVQGSPNSGRATAALLVGVESPGLYADWLIFFDDMRRRPNASTIGNLCVVELEDGRMFVKKLTQSKNRQIFHLLSQGANPIFDVAVKWAARIELMRPK